MAEMSVAAPPSLTLVCGVMASGKSTVGLQLASHWGAVFHDADAFHDAENVAKMTRGEPLTDADRAPWLRRLRVDADERISAWAGRVTEPWLAEDQTWFSSSVQKELRSPRSFLATHFFNHQTHHRGQAHALITACGEKTGDTDLFLVVEPIV